MQETGSVSIIHHFVLRKTQLVHRIYSFDFGLRGLQNQKKQNPVFQQYPL